MRLLIVDIFTCKSVEKNHIAVACTGPELSCYGWLTVVAFHLHTISMTFAVISGVVSFRQNGTYLRAHSFRLIFIFQFAIFVAAYRQRNVRVGKTVCKSNSWVAWKMTAHKIVNAKDLLLCSRVLCANASAHCRTNRFRCFSCAPNVIFSTTIIIIIICNGNHDQL